MRILIGVVVLLFILPSVGVQCMRAWFHRKPITRFNRQLIGKDMRTFVLSRVLIANRPIVDFDQWFLYLKGDLDLVGPKPVDLKSLHQFNKGDRKRFEVAPGIVSPYAVKKAAGIAYQSETKHAVDFVVNDSVIRRFGLIVVWWVQKLVGPNKSDLIARGQFSLFGVTIVNTTMAQAVNEIISRLDLVSTQAEQRQHRASAFAFVNADCANKYYRNEKYRNTLNGFDGVFADGIGLKIAARWKGIALRDNVNGTDMWPLLCDQLNDKRKRVYLFGASKSVVKKVASKLSAEYPDIVIAGYDDGFSFKDKPSALCQKINASGADLLVVAMGAPRQEQWIHDNIDLLKVKAVIGVGGLFDFYSGSVSRAPEWLRELSLEWVWRLAVQPLDKGKRYLYGNPLFLIRVATQKLTQSHTTKTVGA